MNKYLYDESICCGCGTCVAACPQSAIKMVINKEKGIYLSEVSEEKCNNCGLCIQVCPGKGINYKEMIHLGSNYHNLIGNYHDCYLGYAIDKEIRYNSTSGGIITSLLIYALDEGIIDGALVTKMDEKNPLQAISFIAKSKNDIIKSANSKYCPVHTNSGLKELEDLDGKYAVVGLPCHIHGLRKIERLNKQISNKISLRLGLFCVRTISINGTYELLKKLNIARDEILHLEYRGRGWPGGMTIELKNGKSTFISTKEYYNQKFVKFSPFRCVMCYDHTNEFSDLSFGDAWGLNNNDRLGSSVIINRNSKYENILRDMEDKNLIFIKKITENDIINSQKAIKYKKIDIGARIKMANLLRINTPNYNAIYPTPRLSAYLKIKDILRYAIVNWNINKKQ